jgi:hypothetical protein
MQKNSILTALLVLISTGCVSVLSRVSDEEAWNEYYKDQKLEQHHEERTLASESRSGAKILRQMLEGLPFRNYLISCDQRECYQSQLVLAFDQSFRRVKDQNIIISREEYESEQKYFLENYSYEKMMNWVEGFHRMLLSGVELRAAQRAVDLSHDCESAYTATETPVITNFSPFLGGVTYLPHPYYSCLNDHWQNELDELLIETTDRLGIVIKTEEAKRWILQRQISPIYRKTMNDVFAKKKQEELVVWNQLNQDSGHKVSFEQIPELRKRFHFLNLEALLTDKKQSKK